MYNHIVFYILTNYTTTIEFLYFIKLLIIFKVLMFSLFNILKVLGTHHAQMTH